MKLTTGQMLDRLGINDTAINQKGWIVGYDHNGNLLTWDKGKDKPQIKEGNEFHLYYPWIKDTWEIMPYFVSFEEAQKAHKNEKKTIVFHQDKDLQYRFVYGQYGHLEQLVADGIGLHELMEDKWTIES